MTQTESEFLYHTSCDNCNSSDANSVYSDGHAYCFSCNTTTQGQSTMELTPITKQESNFIKGEHLPLNKRKINSRRKISKMICTMSKSQRNNGIQL